MAVSRGNQLLSHPEKAKGHNYHKYLLSSLSLTSEGATQSQKLVGRKKYDKGLLVGSWPHLTLHLNLIWWKMHLLIAGVWTRGPLKDPCELRLFFDSDVVPSP